jgi:hypothetical protein
MKEIRDLMTSNQAHVGFDKVIDGVDVALINEVRGHSLWQLLEHIRVTQADLLRYMTDSDYTHDLAWPGDYWPSKKGDAEKWQRSVTKFREDHQEILALVDGDLLRPTPSAAHHSILRDLLVLADHNAYHLGQMTLVRKLLGNWG